MMDGRIGKIRKFLDKNGYHDVQLLSYAVKYASNFYGPFRDAIGSKKSLVSDKKNYQMDFANINESIREVALDIKEGADMVMVKPGMPYLDVIKNIKDKSLAFVITRRDGNSPARYSEAVMANFALTQGVSQEEVSDWKSQLEKAEQQGRFGFTSFPVMTSAYLG